MQIFWLSTKIIYTRRTAMRVGRALRGGLGEIYGMFREFDIEKAAQLPLGCGADFSMVDRQLFFSNLPNRLRGFYTNRGRTTIIVYQRYQKLL